MFKNRAVLPALVPCTVPSIMSLGYARPASSASSRVRCVPTADLGCQPCARRSALSIFRLQLVPVGKTRATSDRIVVGGPLVEGYSGAPCRPSPLPRACSQPPPTHCSRLGPRVTVQAEREAVRVGVGAGRYQTSTQHRYFGAYRLRRALSTTTPALLMPAAACNVGREGDAHRTDSLLHGCGSQPAFASYRAVPGEFIRRGSSAFASGLRVLRPYQPDP